MWGDHGIHSLKALVLLLEPSTCYTCPVKHSCKSNGRDKDIKEYATV
jgi:hypothetical protein